MINKRVGTLRHWGELQTRTSAESGTNDASISYATIAKMRCGVTVAPGAQLVNGRGGDQSRTPTHLIEFKRVPNLSKAKYILMLNGPYKGIRLKIDESTLSKLGRRMIFQAYIIGDKDEFSQPTTPTIPDIIG